MPDQTENETMLEAAHRLGEVQEINHVPVVVHRGDMRVTEFERLMDKPQRAKTTAQMLSLSSFVAYVNRHAIAGHTIVKFNRNALGLESILDYHGADVPSWGSHRAALTLEHHRQFKAWNALTNQTVSQATFADFIERNIGDIIEPSGAEMLTVAQHLEATKSEKFVSGVRLANGDAAFTFTSETQANGSTKVPTVFKIAVPVFTFSTTRTPMEVMLRYRVSSGQLTFTVLIPSLEDVIDAVWKEMKAQVEAGMPSGVECFDAQTGVKSE